MFDFLFPPSRRLKHRKRRRSFGLRLFVFRDIFQPAVKDPAKLAQREGADVFVLAKAVELPGADVVFFDQFILGYPFPLHRFP